MGVVGFSRSTFEEYKTVFDQKYALPNPNPDNYIVLQSMEIGSDYLILKIKYPDCNNYEGEKILVFYNTTLLDLTKQGKIDPHFCENKNYKSPIARFIPTDEGWKMAKKFCQMMNG